MKRYEASRRQKAMCFNDGLVGCVTFTSAMVVLLAGIPCWIVGTVKPDYYTGDVLTAIPIVPSGSELTDKWYAAELKEGEKYADPSSLVPLEFDVFEKDFQTLDNSVSLFILHNAYGRNIDLSLSSSKGSMIKSFHESVASNIGDTHNCTIRWHSPLSLPSQLKRMGDFRVRCPYSTYPTKKHGIEPRCNSTDGYFMQLSDSFLLTETFSLSPKYLHGRGKITLKQFEFLPFDFIHEPQAYFGFWKKTNSYDIRLAGAIITGAGLIMMVITMILFYSYLVNEP